MLRVAIPVSRAHCLRGVLLCPGSLLCLAHRSHATTTAGVSSSSSVVAGPNGSMRRLRNHCGTLFGMGGAATTQRRWSHARPTPTEISQALSCLNVTVNIDKKELKRKYIAMVKEHHPDKGGNEEKMKNITRAYKLINSLTNGEKAEYAQQRTAHYRSPRAGQAGSAAYGRAASSDFSSGRNQNYQQAYDFRQAYEAAQKSNHAQNQFRRDFNSEAMRKFYQEHGSNPFAANPIHFVRAQMGLSNINIWSLMLRGLLAYGALTLVCLLFIRSYNDYVNNDGWKSADGLRRIEEMETAYKQRQEMLQQVRESRRMNAQQMERTRESQAKQTALQHQEHLMTLERNSWPQFSQDLGILRKYPTDPVGVTYFEPTSSAPRKVSVTVTKTGPSGVMRE